MLIENYSETLIPELPGEYLPSLPAIPSGSMHLPASEALAEPPEDLHALLCQVELVVSDLEGSLAQYWALEQANNTKQW